jgi:hypothetical protein
LSTASIARSVPNAIKTLSTPPALFSLNLSKGAPFGCPCCLCSCSLPGYMVHSSCPNGPGASCLLGMKASVLLGAGTWPALAAPLSGRYRRCRVPDLLTGLLGRDLVLDVEGPTCTWSCTWSSRALNCSTVSLTAWSVVTVLTVATVPWSTSSGTGSRVGGCCAGCRAGGCCGGCRAGGCCAGCRAGDYCAGCRARSAGRCSLRTQRSRVLRLCVLPHAISSEPL